MCTGSRKVVCIGSENQPSGRTRVIGSSRGPVPPSRTPHYAEVGSIRPWGDLRQMPKNGSETRSILHAKGAWNEKSSRNRRILGEVTCRMPGFPAGALLVVALRRGDSLCGALLAVEVLTWLWSDGTAYLCLSTFKYSNFSFLSR